MTYRDQLIDYLARLVEDELITEAEARDYLQRFDAGEVAQFELPLTPDEQIIGVKERDLKPAEIALLLLLFGSTNAGQQLDRMTHADRLGAIELVQDEFEATVTSLANRLKTGVLSIVEWQRGMAETVRDYTIQQARVGHVGALTLVDVGPLNESVQTNTAFLSRFGDTIAAETITKRELTLKRIINQAKAYGSSGRAIAYRGAEVVAVGRGEIGGGWVIDYTTMHDDRVCRSCWDAERANPWLPTDGPMPTEVCEGWYACRCRRIPRFSPEDFAALGGIGAIQPQPADAYDVYQSLRARRPVLEQLVAQQGIDKFRANSGQ